MKKEIVIGLSVLISASLPISVYAAPNESMNSREFLIDETNEFEDIVVIRQIKRCLFRQIKTGLSEHLTMG